MLMNSGLFGVRNVKPDANPKKQGLSETLLNSRCDVHVADTSHGTSHRKQISLHDPLIETIRHDVLLSEIGLEISKSPVI